MTSFLWETAVTRAQDIANQYAQLPQVEAVALGGSQATKQATSNSDIDLYVYSHQMLPLAERAQIAKNNASYSQLNNQFWEPGDEWIDASTKIHVDAMFRQTAWIEAELDRVLVAHQASVGYSTCFWHNVLTSTILFDRSGWYSKLQERTKRPYPLQLQQNIIAKNFPILRNTLSSYLYQLKSAARRKDKISFNHRVAALIASYFDTLFAINKLPHPGEKQLLHMAVTHCKRLPENFESQVNSVLQLPADEEEISIRVNALIEGLASLIDDSIQI